MLTTSHIRNWIRNGALEELEMVVLEGQASRTIVLMLDVELGKLLLNMF